jgi:hypothetical protein
MHLKFARVYLLFLVPAAENLLDYFEVTYVTGRRRVIRRQNNVLRVVNGEPEFPPCQWNVRNETLQGGDRTNNLCESWNNR